MSFSKHNVSNRTAIRLQGCQVGDFALGNAEDRRRFWAKVRVLDSDNLCWLWTGARTSNGRYGQFMWASVYGRLRPVGAHRAAYELTHGPIPAGLHIIHSCDVPLCVNPNHLSVGTREDNMRDASRKGRLHVQRPKRQKVSSEQLAEMVALVVSGRTQQSVAKQFGVSKTFVSLVLSGKRRTCAPAYLSPASRKGVA